MLRIKNTFIFKYFFAVDLNTYSVIRTEAFCYDIIPFMKKVIFRGKKFNIVQEIYKGIKGTKIKEYCERLPSVIVLVITKDEKILLLREFRKERKEYNWGLVSGHVEKNEIQQPVLAAKRELLEEAGFIAKKIKLFFISEPSSSIKWKRYVYIVKDFSKSNDLIKKDNDEKIETHYLAFAKVINLCLDGQIKNETASMAIIRYLAKEKHLLKVTSAE